MKMRLHATLTLGLIVTLAVMLLLPMAAAAKPITLSYANFPPAPTFPCV